MWLQWACLFSLFCYILVKKCKKNQISHQTLHFFFTSSKRRFVPPPPLQLKQESRNARTTHPPGRSNAHWWNTKTNRPSEIPRESRFSNRRFHANARPSKAKPNRPNLAHHRLRPARSSLARLHRCHRCHDPRILLSLSRHSASPRMPWGCFLSATTPTVTDGQTLVLPSSGAILEASCHASPSCPSRYRLLIDHLLDFVVPGKGDASDMLVEIPLACCQR
jgi:hypothetical protein